MVTIWEEFPPARGSPLSIPPRNDYSIQVRLTMALWALEYDLIETELNDPV